MKTGIYGGTFDPPHIGHLIVAQDALEVLGLDRVLFVPAGQPPHKNSEAVTPGALRTDLLRAAVGDDPRFGICEIEVRREGPSYTVDTLRALRQEFPGDDLYLLVGADQVRELENWREPDTIAALAFVVLVSRDGVAHVPEAGPRLHRSIEVTRIDLSATDIRRRIADGRSIRFLVPEAVEQLIHDRRLYRRAPDTKNARSGVSAGARHHHPHH